MSGVKNIVVTNVWLLSLLDALGNCCILNVICAYRKHFTVAALEIKIRDAIKCVISMPTDTISVIHLIVTTVLVLVYISNYCLLLFTPSHRCLSSKIKCPKVHKTERVTRKHARYTTEEC